jgi:hypothetical protein
MVPRWFPFLCILIQWTTAADDSVYSPDSRVKLYHYRCWLSPLVADRSSPIFPHELWHRSFVSGRARSRRWNHLPNCPCHLVVLHVLQMLSLLCSTAKSKKTHLAFITLQSDSSSPKRFSCKTRKRVIALAISLALVATACVVLVCFGFR